MSRELLLGMGQSAKAQNNSGWRRHILQDKCGTLNMRGYVWDSFAARIDTVQDYYNRSMDLLRPDIRAELFNPQRPVYAKENDAASTYIDPAVECVNSLISDGCDIQGNVRNSIIFRGVKVEKGACVENCILFKDTVVKAGATVRNVIAEGDMERAARLLGARYMLSGVANEGAIAAIDEYKMLPPSGEYRCSVECEGVTIPAILNIVGRTATLSANISGRAIVIF